MDLPFSAACERNRGPILEQLNGFFVDRRRVLEIGSGTGQHAAFIAAAMPRLSWQCSDRPDYLPGLRARLQQAALDNTPPPIELDVMDAAWPDQTFDALFSANTLHIMAWAEVERLFSCLPEVCADDAKLAIYGPFNIDGRFTSDSNATFDASLRQRAPHMGIRDIGAVNALAVKAGFRLCADHPMPANNRLLFWRRG
ncbi:DUF938 domain-containing protein [Pseudoxanthomonas sp. CAU 1598]|uniref:DUF938 domain-containing protein n=1 Tax=Pseudomarimonas arenosa TaxID=2774145 RepID=A0AAW3ZJX4_9GAMM|nr:DUF938 domain-containing protein [Pseudomarimonas arenosa]